MQTEFLGGNNKPKKIEDLQIGTIQSLKYHDFIHRLTDINLDEINEEKLSVIVTKFLSITKGTSHQGSLESFYYMLDKIDDKVVSHFYDVIIELYGYYINHPIFKNSKDEINTKFQRIKNINNETNQEVVKILESVNNKTHNTLNYHEKYNLMYNETLEKLLSNKYNKLLNPDVNNTDFSKVESLNQRLNTYIESDQKSKLYYNGDYYELHKERFIKILQDILEYNPEILQGHIGILDNSIMISFDFIEGIIQQFKARNSDLEDLSFIDTDQLNDSNKNKLTNYINITGNIQTEEKKHPMFPGKTMYTKYFTDQNINNIKQYYKTLIQETE